MKSGYYFFGNSAEVVFVNSRNKFKFLYAPVGLYYTIIGEKFKPIKQYYI